MAQKQYKVLSVLGIVYGGYQLLALLAGLSVTLFFRPIFSLLSRRNDLPHSWEQVQGFFSFVGYSYPVLIACYGLMLAAGILGVVWGCKRKEKLLMTAFVLLLISVVIFGVYYLAFYYPYFDMTDVVGQVVDIGGEAFRWYALYYRINTVANILFTIAVIGVSIWHMTLSMILYRSERERQHIQPTGEIDF